jgi:N-acetylglucosaminyldiphosphoundecaprenol N-acetyl-beta-D-mannosaminyltransferase
MAQRRSSVLGVGVDALTMDDVVRCCAEAIERREPLVLGVVNAGKIVSMQRDSELREAVIGCDLVIADGMAVVWASRLLRSPLPERVAGIDLFLRLLEQANERSQSVYLLGATEAVLRSVVGEISRSYPRVRIAGRRNGYFEEAEAPAIATEIRAARPDLLFLGISSPKKELFLARWGTDLGVAVAHGVGGSFDVLAGKVTRAPRSWQRLGLEWLYRVFQEPRRMWRRYLVTNTAFLYLLVRELLGFRRPLS